MRTGRILAVILVAVALAAAFPAPPFLHLGGDAVAQQRQQQQQQQQQRQFVRPPNLLELLFGGGLRRQMQQRQKAEPPKARRVIVAPKKRTGSEGSVTVVEAAPKTVVEKVENAAKVLVVGDFMADNLHFGLEQAYAENPNVVVLNESSGLSGLVREDVVDWPAKTAELIEAHRPVAVVVLVGMNDRQQLRLSSGRVEKLTDPWKAEYEKRVAELVSAVRSRNLTLVWLGLPPVKSGGMNSDYLVFNEVYRSAVEAAGGRFIDVWDGFTNAEGQFVSAGPDVNGQIVRLRNSDGINMTRAAKLKLAFYAERELKRLLGLGTSAEIASLGPGGVAQPLEPEYDPAASGRTIVISFDTPQVDGGDVLDGGPNVLENEKASLSTAYALVAKGAAMQPHDGRVDAAWGLPDIPREPSVEELKARGALSSAPAVPPPAAPASAN